MTNLTSLESHLFEPASSFDWSQPIRWSEKLFNALMITRMENGINIGYINIYRDEQEDFCGNSVFITKEEAIDVGLSAADSFDNITILFDTVEVLMDSILA